jgi:hypothetical protein
MQQRIRRFDVMQTAMTLGALYFFLGIIIAILAWLFMGAIRGMGGAMGNTGSGGMGMLGGGGIAMVIIMPIIYGAVGAVFAAIAAMLYNVVAGWTGGIGMELE